MFTVSVQRGEAYLLIVASGPAGLDEIRASNRFTEELVQRTGARRLLLDMLAFSPELHDGDAGRVTADLEATSSPLERIAILVPRTESRGFLLHVALSRGIDAQEFDDIRQAEAWLLR